MGSIKYSLSMRPNPTDESAPKKAYATAQASSFIDLDQLCEHIAQHGSIWTPDIVNGVVRKLVSCMEELLVSGNTVSLGNIGSFHVAFKCKGADSFETFSTSGNIKKVYPVWTRGRVFKDLRNSKLGVTFEQVLTKKEETRSKETVYGKKRN